MPESPDTLPVALLVTRNFPPLLGGMENVNQRLLRELAEEWQIALCGPAGCGAHAPEAIDVRETKINPLWRFLLGTTFRAIAMARRLRPTLVLAGSGLVAPIAWAAARLSGGKYVVYLHGLDIIVASPVYQMFWLPFIRACDLALVNSENSAGLAIGKGVPSDRVQVLHPGTDIPDLDPEAGQEFKERLGLAGRSLLLSVGRLTRRKGLAEFAGNSLPAIVARDPAAMLVVIGEEASDALHTMVSSERERISKAAKVAGVESNILFVGRCDAADLSAAYQAAQVHVFPVLEQVGDVEGFGMVALEAAAHGLRTVAFSVGGVPDAIDRDRSGTLVPSGAYDALSDAVIEALESQQTEAGVAASREFASGKDWRNFGLRLRSLVKNI
jgi:phosphatidylinositol alpha-1,6-mannosyltransferase